MSNGTFDFNAFIKESKDVLVNPKSYFAEMKISGGIAEPLIKAVLYGVIAGVIALIWGLLKIGGATGSMFGGAVGVMALFGYIIAAVIGLFIGGIIILVISAICKGNTDFEANVRVAASLMVVMPISAFFGFASGINIYLGVFISLAINIFSLWLLYNALNESLKANPGTSKILTIVLAAILVLFMVLGLGAKKAADDFMKDFNSTDVKELLKEMEEN